MGLEQYRRNGVHVNRCELRGNTACFEFLSGRTLEEELDEELRLMYVATTRAKTYLYITYPVDMFDHATGMVLSKPSRFLDNIGEDILEHWVLEVED